jgi:hypothetical protein
MHGHLLAEATRRDEHGLDRTRLALEIDVGERRCDRQRHDDRNADHERLRSVARVAVHTAASG